MEGLSGIVGAVSRLLELFQQKAVVFVDVCFGDDKPYTLTVSNRSRFDICLEELVATPDGFPFIENGWCIKDGSLFRNKRLKPGQKIRIRLSAKDIGTQTHRTFSITYSTYLGKLKVARLVQRCEHEFEQSSQTIGVRATVRMNFER